MAALTGQLASTLIVAALLAQSPDGTIPAEVAKEAQPTQTWQEAVAFTERVKELGPWQDQTRLITQMVDSVFTQNGWNSEPDVFARNLILQTSSMPPWDVRGRIDTFTNILSTRYRLNPQQREDLRSRVWRDIVTLTTRSFPALLPTLAEMIETRADGRPFTSEQVSRWVRTTRPIMDRNMGYVRESLGEFRETLTAEQQEVLDRDIAAADRRVGVMLDQMKNWERGSWTPKDWGLDRDPIHAGTQGRAVPVQRSRPDRSAELRQAQRGAADSLAVARDQDQWERYVEQFIRRYELDAAQQTSAWSIYADLKSRADQWQVSHATEIAELEQQVGQDEDPTARQDAQTRLNELKEPLGQMFAELKDRLENLLTGEQRAGGSDSQEQDR